jgi:hypothetical protein
MGMGGGGVAAETKHQAAQLAGRPTAAQAAQDQHNAAMREQQQYGGIHVVSLSVVPVTESSEVQLVAVTDEGVRIYLSTRKHTTADGWGLGGNGHAYRSGSRSDTSAVPSQCSSSQDPSDHTPGKKLWVHSIRMPPKSKIVPREAEHDRGGGYVFTFQVSGIVFEYVSSVRHCI